VDELHHILSLSIDIYKGNINKGSRDQQVIKDISLLLKVVKQQGRDNARAPIEITFKN